MVRTHHNAVSTVRHPVRPVSATVKRALPNEMFLVETEAGVELTVHASGKMRNRFVRLLSGDSVLVDRSPFDATKGRIVHEGMSQRFGGATAVELASAADSRSDASRPS